MGFLSKDQLAGIMSAVKSYTSDVERGIREYATNYTKNQTYERISYNNLKGLVSNYSLIPGKKYSINDYVTTTTSEHTCAPSYSPFDIVVTALTDRELSHDAQVVLPNGSFSLENCEKWEIKYDIFNDRNRYSWADDIEHCGFGFYVPEDGWLDENGEEYSGDLHFRDVIQGMYSEVFDDFEISVIDDVEYYLACWNGSWQVYFPKKSFEELTHYPYNTGIIKIVARNTVVNYTTYCQTLPEFLHITGKSKCNGKGVIYYMKDEWGNEAGYDFKNIMFKRWLVAPTDPQDTISDTGYCGYKRITDSHRDIPSKLSIIDDEYIWAYTFSDTNDGALLDASRNEFITCRGNVILPYMTGETQHLNDIVMYGNVSSGNRCIENNKFETNCFSMTIGGGVTELWENKFGQYARGNIIVADNIYQNNFGQNLSNNIIVAPQDQSYIYHNNIGNYCQNNTITALFKSNDIGSHFKDNTIHTWFGQNNIGNEFMRNTSLVKFTLNNIGQQCQDNLFNNEFTKNTIQDGLIANVFNGTCKGCEFSTLFSDNVINTRLNICVFGGSTSNNKFGDIINSKFGAMFQGNEIGIAKACDFGIGFRYNKFTNSTTGGNNVRVSCCKFGDYIWYNNFYNTDITGDSTSMIQNLNVQSNLQGSETSTLNIEVPKDSTAEIKVAKNSKGDIKVYCEADLIA
jgi:hypothetical protein